MITHQGLKGEFSEILISGLFRPLLPADVGVGSGQIMCSYTGRLSSQIDVVLYDKRILPPILIDDRVGVFPIEAVLYAIEIKTTLTREALRETHIKASKLLSDFGYRPGMYGEGGSEINHSVEKVRCALFALNSDLRGTGISEIERYGDVCAETWPSIVAMCIVGKEYWFQGEECWHGIKDEEEFDGVLSFLGGVMNTYQNVSRSRGFPKLGNYIVPETVPETVRFGPELPLLRCESCCLKFRTRVTVGKASLSIDGSLDEQTPCSACGGKLRAAPGRYKSFDGVLVIDKTT